MEDLGVNYDVWKQQKVGGGSVFNTIYGPIRNKESNDLWITFLTKWNELVTFPNMIFQLMLFYGLKSYWLQKQLQQLLNSW